MTPELQIKALAELDGYSCGDGEIPYNDPFCVYTRKDDINGVYFSQFCYLISRNAIIPLIQKLWRTGILAADKFLKQIEIMVGEPVSILDVLDLTPAQLCEATLRATNSWIE